jgi:hypothetical protein
VFSTSSWTALDRLRAMETKLAGTLTQSQPETLGNMADDLSTGALN